jgi:hypothetical protein
MKQCGGCGGACVAVGVVLIVVIAFGVTTVVVMVMWFVVKLAKYVFCVSDGELGGGERTEFRKETRKSDEPHTQALAASVFL